MLTSDQVSELKKQLQDQIKHLPNDQRQQAEQQIEELSDEALEEMLKEQKSKKPQKSPLRMIVARELPAHILIETKQAYAVLDIKPISKGHTLIIPKVKIEDAVRMPSSLFSLARRIASKIKRKLKPKTVEIQTETKFGEHIINIIPIYDKPLSFLSPRYEPPKGELERMQLELVLISRKRVKKQPTITHVKTLPIVKRRVA